MISWSAGPNEMTANDMLAVETPASLIGHPRQEQQLRIASQDAQGHRVLSDRKRWFLDSLLIICLLLMVAAKSIIPAASMDEDLWWHVSTGRWILSHHTVPTHDPFPTSSMGSSWIAYTWLFDVISSKTYDTWGLHGILTMTTLLTLGFVVAVVVLLSRQARMVRATVLSALVFTASASLISPRPWLFTCNFAVAELYFLLQAHERGKVVWLAPILPLFAVWANLHIQFVYGLGLIGLFALERPLTALLKWDPPETALRSRHLWALLAGSILATLVNPYGWRIYEVVAQYATETAPLQFVQEMQPMQFRSVTDWAAFFLACLAVFTIARSGRRCFLMISLLVVSFWFGFRTGRDVWFLSLVSALVIAYATRSSEPGLRKIRCAQWAIVLPASLGLAFAVLGAPGVSAGALQQAVEKRFPEKASAYIQDHSLQGPLYNPYGWGGYLIWRLPHMALSIDGRANLYGDARLTRFFMTWSGHRDWAEDTELRKAKTILLERDNPLASILSSDSRFRLVYEDDVASVFQPVLK